MKFDIITLFPELVQVYTGNGIINRAIDNNLFQLNYINLRDFSKDKHK